MSGITSVQWEEYTGPFPAVKLKGLPHSATLDDIFQFFQILKPVELKPIDIVTEFKNNQLSGSIGVLFSCKEDANKALQLNRKTISGRYIQVFPLKRSEYHALIHDQVQAAKPRRGPRPIFRTSAATIKITGLSYDTEYDDILRIFESKFLPLRLKYVTCFSVLTRVY